MFKPLLIVAVLAGAGMFLIGRIPSWKQQAIEVINPAEREARVLGALKVNLEALEEALSQVGGAKTLKEVAAELDKTKDIINDSQKLADEAASINQSAAKALSSQLGQLVNIFSDTPQPGTPILTTPAASCTPR